MNEKVDLVIWTVDAVNRIYFLITASVITAAPTTRASTVIASITSTAVFTDITKTFTTFTTVYATMTSIATFTFLHYA